MKTYIIRLEGHELSTTLAMDCFNAAQNLGYNPEYFKAIDKFNVDGFFATHNLKIAKDDKMNAPGTRGCFASHFSLWKTVEKTKETAIILEHDGMLLKPVDSILGQVKDVCHLDSNDPYGSNYAELVAVDNGLGVKPYERDKAKRVTGKYFRGAYSYVLTPVGASKLIEFVYKNGAFTADRTICENAVELQSTLSSHAMLHPFFDSIQKIKNFCTRVKK